MKVMSVTVSCMQQHV